MQYKYTWARTDFAGVPAEVAGEIVRKAGTAEMVVKAAQDPSNPLHRFFDWDETSAARKYRLIQAREMIGSLRVEVITKDRGTQRVPAFVRRVDKVGYVATLEADEEEFDEAEERCLKQMREFKARWKGLQFAREVISAIQATEQRAARRKKKKAA